MPKVRPLDFLSLKVTLRYSLSASGNGNEVVLHAAIVDEVLTVRVSCGSQVIQFSDSKLKVSTGYLQTMELSVGVQNGNKCLASFRLNGTHSMRAEQAIDVVPLHPSVIYFGQMPKLITTDGHLNGFHGCMKSLEVTVIFIINS